MWQKDTRARDKPSQHAARGGRRFGPFDPWTFPPFELSMHIVSNVFVISPIFGIMHASNQRAQLRWTKRTIHKYELMQALSRKGCYPVAPLGHARPSHNPIAAKAHQCTRGQPSADTCVRHPNRCNCTNSPKPSLPPTHAPCQANSSCCLGPGP